MRFVQARRAIMDALDDYPGEFGTIDIYLDLQRRMPHTAPSMGTVARLLQGMPEVERTERGWMHRPRYTAAQRGIMADIWRHGTVPEDLLRHRYGDTAVAGMIGDESIVVQDGIAILSAVGIGRARRLALC